MDRDHGLIIQFIKDTSTEQNYYSFSFFGIGVALTGAIVYISNNDPIFLLITIVGLSFAVISNILGIIHHYRKKQFWKHEIAKMKNSK